MTDTPNCGIRRSSSSCIGVNAPIGEEGGRGGENDSMSEELRAIWLRKCEAHVAEQASRTELGEGEDDIGGRWKLHRE